MSVCVWGGFLLGVMKMSRNWWLLHNCMNILKTIELHTFWVNFMVWELYLNFFLSSKKRKKKWALSRLKAEKSETEFLSACHVPATELIV